MGDNLPAVLKLEDGITNDAPSTSWQRRNRLEIVDKSPCYTSRYVTNFLTLRIRANTVGRMMFEEDVRGISMAWFLFVVLKRYTKVGTNLHILHKRTLWMICFTVLFAGNTNVADV